MEEWEVNEEEEWEYYDIWGERAEKFKKYLALILFVVNGVMFLECMYLFHPPAAILFLLGTYMMASYINEFHRSGRITNKLNIVKKWRKRREEG